MANPVIEEELLCKREIGNAHDTHALVIRNIIDYYYSLSHNNDKVCTLDEDIKTFLRVPRKILICWHRICAVRFLLDEVASSILCIVKGITNAPRICHRIDGLVYSR